MSSQTPPREEAHRTDTIRRNTTFAFIAQITGQFFTAGLTIFLARQLGTHGYGIYSLALGIGGLLLFPADFGISTSASRFVAERLGDRTAVASVTADAVRLKLIVSATLSALLFGLASPLASAYGTDALVWPIRGVAIALFGQSLMQMSTLFVALRRVDSQFMAAFGESSVETTATVALVLAGAGVTGAMFGRAIGFTVGGAITVLLVVRLVGRESIPRTLRAGEHTRAIATYGGVILVTDGAFTLFNQVDVLIIGGYLGASAVALFSAPLRLITFLGGPGGAISSGVSPLLARGRGREPNVGAFLRAMRLLLILQALIVAFVLGWAGLLVNVLGSHFDKSVEVLRALAPFIFMLGFGPLVSGTVNFLGEARRRVPVAVATAIINIVADLILVPSIGVVGASIGTDLAYCVYAPAHLYICWRALGMDLRPTARTALRALAAAAAATGVLLLIGDSLHEAWRIPLGAIAGPVTFGAVLWLTGELTPREAAALLGQLPGARGLRGRGRSGEGA
jgi:O-antigen/teichoic acid export membrane protein